MLKMLLVFYYFQGAEGLPGLPGPPGPDGLPVSPVMIIDLKVVLLIRRSCNVFFQPRVDLLLNVSAVRSLKMHHPYSEKENANSHQCIKINKDLPSVISPSVRVFLALCMILTVTFW